MVYHAVALGTALDVGQILVHLDLLPGGGQLPHQFALGSEDEECHAEHGVGTCGEDGELHVAVCHADAYLGTLAAAYPVLLRLLDAVAPLQCLQAVQQALGVGADAQAPLTHLLLLHGIAASLAHSVDHLVVGQHGTQFGTPVHHRLAQEGYAVVHQGAALLLLAHGLPLGGREGEFLAACGRDALGAAGLEVPDQRVYGHGLVGRGAEV